MSDVDQPLTMQDRLLLASLLSTLPGRNGRADLQAACFDLEMLLEELQNSNSNVRAAATAALGNLVSSRALNHMPEHAFRQVFRIILTGLALRR